MPGGVERAASRSMIGCGWNQQPGDANRQPHLDRTGNRI
jgi:hypothetical protein